jgi:hypothetical protein
MSIFRSAERLLHQPVSGAGEEDGARRADLPPVLPAAGLDEEEGLDDRRDGGCDFLSVGFAGEGLGAWRAGFATVLLLCYDYSTKDRKMNEPGMIIPGSFVL